MMPSEEITVGYTLEGELDLAGKANLISPHLEELINRRDQGDLTDQQFEAGLEILIETHGGLDMMIGDRHRQIDLDGDRHKLRRYANDHALEICECGGLIYGPKAECWVCRE